MASLSSWKRATRDVVNSLEFKSLLTSFCDSDVTMFYSWAAAWRFSTKLDYRSRYSFSLAKALSKKFSKAL